MVDWERWRINAETTALRSRVKLRLAANLVGLVTVGVAGYNFLLAPAVGPTVFPFYRLALGAVGLGQLAAPWVSEIAAMVVGACLVWFV
jgi:hypothetical protein